MNKVKALLMTLVIGVFALQCDAAVNKQFTIREFRRADNGFRYILGNIPGFQYRLSMKSRGFRNNRVGDTITVDISRRNVSVERRVQICQGCAGCDGVGAWATEFQPTSRFFAEVRLDRAARHGQRPAQRRGQGRRRRRP